MTAITIDQAAREFYGNLVVGQYVAHWISDDRQSSMPMTVGSYATDAEAVKAARAEGEAQGVIGGFYAASKLADD